MDNLFTERKARKKYDEAVRYILNTNPVLGVILYERLRPVADWEHDCYYTNGIVIGYNPDAVMSMSLLNNVFIIAHEVWHCLMCHATRRNGRDKRLWNIAGDYLINSLLVSQGIGEMPTDKDGNPDGLLDWDYDGRYMDTERCYDLLNDKAEKSKPKPQPDPKGDPKPDKKPDQESQGHDTIAEQFKEEIEKIKMGIVDDYVAEGENSWDAEGEETDYITEVEVTPQELEDMFNEARVHGEFSQGKTSGVGAFDFEGIIDLNKKHTISWEDILKEYLTVKSKTKKNWMKPSAKWLNHGFWMPTKTGKKLDDIVIMIDESGSMGEDEIEAVFNNINQLFEDGDIPLCRVALIHFAGHSNIPDQYVEYVDEGEIPEYRRLLNGGTDFQAAFNKAVELEERGEINPSCYIMMTDMYDEYPPEPDFPVLWMSVTPEDSLYCLPKYGSFTQLII